MKKMKGSTILLLVGILVFSVGCIGPFMYEDAIEKGYKVEATVTRIKEGTDVGTDGMPDSTVYTYYGEYEVDGKKYTDVKLGKSYDEKSTPWAVPWEWWSIPIIREGPCQRAA